MAGVKAELGYGMGGRHESPNFGKRNAIFHPQRRRFICCFPVGQSHFLQHLGFLWCLEDVLQRNAPPLPEPLGCVQKSSDLCGLNSPPSLSSSPPPTSSTEHPGRVEKEPFANRGKELDEAEDQAGCQLPIWFALPQLNKEHKSSLSQPWLRAAAFRGLVKSQQM